MSDRWTEEERLRYLSRLSHDLRTPLNAIKGYTEMVIDQPDLTVAEVWPDLKRILFCARHMQTLLDDLGDPSDGT